MNNLFRYGVKDGSLMYPGYTQTIQQLETIHVQKWTEESLLDGLRDQTVMVIVLLPKNYKYSTTRKDLLQNPNLSMLFECLIVWEYGVFSMFRRMDRALDPRRGFSFDWDTWFGRLPTIADGNIAIFSPNGNYANKIQIEVPKFVWHVSPDTAQIKSWTPVLAGCIQITIRECKVLDYGENDMAYTFQTVYREQLGGYNLEKTMPIKFYVLFESEHVLLGNSPLWRYYRGIKLQYQRLPGGVHPTLNDLFNPDPNNSIDPSSIVPENKSFPIIQPNRFNDRSSTTPFFPNYANAYKLGFADTGDELYSITPGENMVMLIWKDNGEIFMLHIHEKEKTDSIVAYWQHAWPEEERATVVRYTAKQAWKTFVCEMWQVSEYDEYFQVSRKAIEQENQMVRIGALRARLGVLKNIRFEVSGDPETNFVVFDVGGGQEVRASMRPPIDSDVWDTTRWKKHADVDDLREKMAKNAVIFAKDLRNYLPQTDGYATFDEIQNIEMGEIQKPTDGTWDIVFDNGVKGAFYYNGDVRDEFWRGRDNLECEILRHFLKKMRSDEYITRGPVTYRKELSELFQLMLGGFMWNGTFETHRFLTFPEQKKEEKYLAKKSQRPDSMKRLRIQAQKLQI